MYAVKLTSGGQSLLRAAEPAARKTDDRLLSSLSASERDTFLKALDRIVEIEIAAPAAKAVSAKKAVKRVKAAIDDLMTAAELN